MRFNHLQRREFITLLGGAAVVWPVAARAQQPGRMPVIGYLSPGSAKGYTTRVAAFRQGLQEAGYREGQNVAMEYRWAEGQRDRQAAGRNLGLQLHVLHASSEREFDIVFATLVQLRAGGLVVSPDPFFISRSEQLATLTVRHAVVTIFHSREFAAAGGLMSFGGSVAESHRQAGIYTGRILKDDKPADLPIQQVTKIELVINMKTAKALGLTVPLPLLGRADEVIE
jgi:ABC transporter substrate binding protein